MQIANNLFGFIHLYRIVLQVSSQCQAKLHFRTALTGRNGLFLTALAGTLGFDEVRADHIHGLQRIPRETGSHRPANRPAELAVHDFVAGGNGHVKPTVQIAVSSSAVRQIVPFIDGCDHVVQRTRSGMEAGVAHADDRLIIILACARVACCGETEPFGKDPVCHAADEDAVFDDRRVDARRTFIVDMQRDGAMLSEHGMREIGQGDKFACDLFPHIRGSNRILCRDGIGFTGVTDCFVRKHTGKTRRKDALMLATFDFCLVFVCFGEILLQLLISVVCKCMARGVDPSPYLEGKFVIASLERTDPAQDDSTYSVSLENDGEPTVLDETVFSE